MGAISFYHRFCLGWYAIHQNNGKKSIGNGCFPPHMGMNGNVWVGM